MLDFILILAMRYIRDLMLIKETNVPLSKKKNKIHSSMKITLFIFNLPCWENSQFARFG